MIRSRLPLVAALGAVAIIIPTLSQLSAEASVPAERPQLSAAIPLVGDVTALAYDARTRLDDLAPTAAQRAAVAALGDANVTWNGKLGTPRMIGVDGGALTGARAGDPLEIARDWLAEHSALFGLAPADVAAFEVIRNHQLPGIDARVLSFTQTFGGVSAGIGGVLTVVVDRDGRVVSYAGDPVRSSSLLGGFEIPAARALTDVVGSLAPAVDFVARLTDQVQGGYQVFGAGPFADVQRVRRIAFATPAGGRAAYAVLMVKSADEAWAVVVDATTGETLYRKSLVAHSEGTIYENYPGARKGGRPVVKSFGVTKESPGGWVDPTGMIGLPGVTTFGNNADTVAAWTAPIAPADQYNRPVAPLSEFNYEFTNSWAETQGGLLPPSFAIDRDAAVTNLFYHHNRIHDEFYRYGFTETAGNFQLNNFGKGGLGGDPVLGSAQSGAVGGGQPTNLGRNNANMLTLPDGIPGLTSMYLWEPVDDAFEGLYRDGDFDATIIEHEYAHGLSNRYVAGGGLGSLGTTQSGAMGEGWGDWFAMNHLFGEGLTRNAVTAPYVGSTQRGIRNWNYARHPITYGDYGYDVGGPEVHSDGELWTATLWDLRTAILDKVGGNQRKASDIAEHLVMDAMPLSPQAPSMLDMRDAILKAAELRYKNTYTNLLWDVFAQRGMGVSARTKGETDTDPRPGFDHKAGQLNGKLALRLVNASAGGPVKGARVMVGIIDARATPVIKTGKAGTGSARLVHGTYTLTIQAGGYGIQRFPVTIAKGRTTTKVIKLRPNLVSEASGAKIIDVTSENPGLPAEGLVDDTEAVAWKTATTDAPYNKGKAQSVTIRLAKPARVDTVAVSVLKPPSVPRFAAANKVVVQTSLDGKRWKTAQVATFSYLQPRPTVADLHLKTYRLARAVRAGFVRVVVPSVFGSGAEYASAAVVAEVDVFGSAKGIKPVPPKPDKPVTVSGSVAVGNITQGALLLPPTEPYRDGVTTASWKASCPDLPSANGVDAFVMKLPRGSSDGAHALTVTGSVPLGEFLIYYYDETCTPMTGGFGMFEETEVIPPAAAYAGFLLLYGGGASFDMTVSDPR